MGREAGPKAEQLRAMREANYDRNVQLRAQQETAKGPKQKPVKRNKKRDS